MRSRLSLLLIGVFCLAVLCLAAAITVSAVPVPIHKHVHHPSADKPEQPVSFVYPPSPSTPASPPAPADARHVKGSQACVIDAARNTAPAPAPVATGEATERFLLYAPLTGISQQVVLARAVAWATLLNRTLVLPHLLGSRIATQSMVPFRKAFTVDTRHIAPLHVLEIDDLVPTQPLPDRLIVLQSPASFAAPRALSSALTYFDAVRKRAVDSSLESSGSSRNMKPFHVELPVFSADMVREAFGACAVRHRLIAFARLPPLEPDARDVPGRVTRPLPWDGLVDTDPAAAQWQVAGVPGPEWVARTALPSLLVPNARLDELAQRIASVVVERGKDAEPSSSPELTCLWRGADFTVHKCANLLASLRLPGRPPATLLRLLRRGFSCDGNSESELRLNLAHALAARNEAEGTGDDLSGYVDMLEPPTPDPTNQCSAFEVGVDYSGHDCRCMGRGMNAEVERGVPGANDCARMCGSLGLARDRSREVGTLYFTYRNFDGSCWCKHAATGRRAARGFTSGPSCTAPPSPPTPPSPLRSPSPPPRSLALFEGSEGGARRIAAGSLLRVIDSATIDDFSTLISEAQLGMSQEVSSSILEPLVCARATTLLLNAFAPSSEVIRAQAEVHKRSSNRGGAAARGQPHTYFLRRTDPFDGERLLTAVAYGRVRDLYSLYVRTSASE